MDYRKIQLPREIHTGPGLIKETGSICNELRFKGKVLVVSGTHTSKKAQVPEGERGLPKPETYCGIGQIVPARRGSVVLPHITKVTGVRLKTVGSVGRRLAITGFSNDFPRPLRQIIRRLIHRQSLKEKKLPAQHY